MNDDGAAQKQADLQDGKSNDIIKNADAAITAAQAVLNNDGTNGSPASTQGQKDAAQTLLDSATQARAAAVQAAADAKQNAIDWGPTGDYTRALKVVTGIVVGATAGEGTGQIAANAAAPYAARAIGDYFTQPGHENLTAQVLTHAVLGAVLAAANGSSVAGGAGAGASGEVAAQVLSRELYPQAYDPDGSFHPDRLTTAQTNTIIALSTGGGPWCPARPADR